MISDMSIFFMPNATGEGKISTGGSLPLRFSFERDPDVKAYIEQIYPCIIDENIITEKSKVSRRNSMTSSAFGDMRSRLPDSYSALLQFAQCLQTRIFLL